MQVPQRFLINLRRSWVIAAAWVALRMAICGALIGTASVARMKCN